MTETRCDSRCSILIVDDQAEVRDAILRTLRAAPYRLLTAGGGEEAMRVMAAEPVHVLLTDLMMPGMDGLALVQEVEARHPHVVRMVMSGRNDAATILDLVNRGGVYRYLTKPWQNVELKANIKQAADFYDLQERERRLKADLAARNRQLVSDVTRRTRQLAAMERTAEIGRYASHLVHNLNTPLHSIFGSVELLRLRRSMGSFSEADLDEYLGIIENAARNIQGIVSGVLTTARQSPGAVEILDINALIRDRLQFYRLNPAFRYEVHTQLYLSDPLPPIRGNALEVLQLMDNLVTNALHAMKGSEKKNLTIATAVDGKTLILTVSDTGCGIADADRQRIFDPEFSTKPPGEGTGLGLASVKTMVDAYSGRIAVASTLGVGTTFSIRLPILAGISADVQTMAQNQVNCTGSEKNC